MGKRLAALFFCLTFLTSCSMQLGTEDLLAPPKLTSEQSALFDALEMAVGTDSFKLKYPRRGDYLSSFVFRDLDRDGRPEAIAFYELTIGQTTSTWMSVLVQDKDGNWKSSFEVPGAGSEVDFVSFAPVSQIDRDNIIVGWSVAGREDMTAVVYSFDGSRVETLYTDNYAELLTADVDQNGLDELILCTKNSARPGVIKLAKYRAGRITTTSEVTLPSGMTGFSQIVFGPITQNLNAVFADITLDGGMVTTVIAAVDRSVLERLSEEDLGIYESFDRPPPTLNCMDANGDGFIDIPVTHPLPGYEENQELDKIYLTEFKSILDGSLETVQSTVVNYANGYRLNFPPGWNERVTVKEQTDTGEWRFVLYNGSLADSTTELLRIKVVSPRDYQDKFETAAYQKIATRGTNDYLAYIPETNYPGLSITYDQLAALFSLT